MLVFTMEESDKPFLASYTCPETYALAMLLLLVRAQIVLQEAPSIDCSSTMPAAEKTDVASHGALWATIWHHWTVLAKSHQPVQAQTCKVQVQEELSLAEGRLQVCQGQLEAAQGQLTETLGQLAEASRQEEDRSQQFQSQLEAAQKQLAETLEQLAEASNRADDLQGQLGDALGQVDTQETKVHAAELRAKLLQEQVRMSRALSLCRSPSGAALA